MNYLISKAVLFTKENCAPCLNLKAFLARFPDDKTEHLTIMNSEHYPTLMGAYDIDKFPTLMLLNGEGEEITRIVGGKKIEANLLNTLNPINANRR